MTTTERINELKMNLVSKIQIYGFWCALMISIGFMFGITYCNKMQNRVTENAIKIGGFIFDSKVYDVKMRTIQ